MDIHEIMNNVELYEQEVAQSVSGEALSLSKVQTLITLYQKAIEYYSAFDDHQFVDIKNRMQSVLQRPEIEALMVSAQSMEGDKQSSSPSPNKNDHDESSFKIEDDDELTYNSNKDQLIKYQEVMQDDDEEEKK